MKAIIIGVVCFFLAAVQWHTNFEEAKQVAGREHKFILLNFSGSDWCGPCIKMKKEVFESEEFLSLAQERLVLIRADFPRQKKNQLSQEQKAHNEALAEKYNPDGKFPFTLLLDENGEVIRQWDGYVFESQENVIAEIRKAIP